MPRKQCSASSTPGFSLFEQHLHFQRIRRETHCALLYFLAWQWFYCDIAMVQVLQQDAAVRLIERSPLLGAVSKKSSLAGPFRASVRQHSVHC